LRKCTRIVSPTRTRKTGPGTEPLNVHTRWTTPGAMVIGLSSTRMSTSCIVPASRGGAIGLNGVPGSFAAPASATAVISLLGRVLPDAVREPKRARRNVPNTNSNAINAACR